MINRSRQPERFLATILFIDIVGSTDLAARLGDREWRRVLGAYYDAVRRQLKQFGGREVDTSGDGFFASFEHPAQAVRAADAILADVSRLSLGLRAGIHTGECEMIGRKVGGIAVHIAARVMAAADSGEVLVSNTVRELVSGSGLEFGDRGTHELKGVPGEWHLYALVRQQPDAAPADGGSAVPATEPGASRGRSRRGVLVGGRGHRHRRARRPGRRRGAGRSRRVRGRHPARPGHGRDARRRFGGCRGGAPGAGRAGHDRG